jgi:hypothetical protein
MLPCCTVPRKAQSYPAFVNVGVHAISDNQHCCQVILRWTFFYDIKAVIKRVKTIHRIEENTIIYLIRGLYLEHKKLRIGCGVGVECHPRCSCVTDLVLTVVLEVCH